MSTRRPVRRGVLALLFPLLVAANLVACSPGPQNARNSSVPPISMHTLTPAPTLPGGSTSLFPGYRLVGFSGAPGAPGQGRLGIGKLDDRVVEMMSVASSYADGRKAMPVMELIATTVHPVPGKDGMFRTRLDDDKIQQWLDTARRHGAILLLNIQPGRASFLDEAKAYEKFLSEPDVGLALDPEWAVKAGQIPGRVFGSTTGAELDEVASWLSALVLEYNLPEKPMIYHQLNPGIVKNETDLLAHEGVALIKSIDGIGSPGAKVETWKRLVAGLPPHIHTGFKLFYEEDVASGGVLMKPAEVLALTPQPEYVLYE